MGPADAYCQGSGIRDLFRIGQHRKTATFSGTAAHQSIALFNCMKV